MLKKRTHPKGASADGHPGNTDEPAVSKLDSKRE